MWCQMLYDHCSAGLEGVKTRCQNMVSKRDMTTNNNDCNNSRASGISILIRPYGHDFKTLGVGSKVSGKSAIFRPLKIALPPPPLFLSLVPIFPKH